MSVREVQKHDLPYISSLIQTVVAKEEGCVRFRCLDADVAWRLAQAWECCLCSLESTPMVVDTCWSEPFANSTLGLRGSEGDSCISKRMLHCW